MTGPVWAMNPPTQQGCPLQGSSPSHVAGLKKACTDPSTGSSIATAPTAFWKALPESIPADGLVDWVRVPLPFGPAPSQRTRRKNALWLIVRDEFRVDYSLIGMLASRARLRFIDRSTLSRDLNSDRRNRTFLLCQEADISTLP